MQSWIFCIITPVLSVTWSFRNHCNMLICCSQNFFYYAWRKKILLCNIFVQIHFSGFFDQYKVQKNSIYFLINVHFWTMHKPLCWVCVHGVYCVCVCVCVCVCMFTAVCVHFGWVIAEHKFRVWVTILGLMSRHFHLMYLNLIKCIFSCSCSFPLSTSNALNVSI